MLSTKTVRRVSLAIFPRWPAAAATYALIAFFLLQQQHGRFRRSSFLADAQSTLGIRTKHFIPITYPRDHGDAILCGVTPGPIKDAGYVASPSTCARTCALYDWPCTMIHIIPSPKNSTFRCILYNYQSVDLFLPTANCTGLKIDNSTLNVVTPSSNLHVVNTNCSYPFTYNGGLYYHCALGYPNLTTTQEPYFCLLPNATAAICDYPDYVEPNYTIPNATLPSGWSTPLMGINGWIIISQKLAYTTTGMVFDRLWQDYKIGFGQVNSNFWIGLENIYQLTNSNNYVLRVELLFRAAHSWYSEEYWNFRISSSETNYTLYVDSPAGDAGDSLMFTGQEYPVPTSPAGSFLHNGMKFSTKDWNSDHCVYPTGCPCASDTYGQGGWWWNRCSWACLTCESPNYFSWTSLTQILGYPMWMGTLDTARMMIRPQ